MLNERDSEQQSSPESSPRSLSKSRPACPPKPRSLRDEATGFVRQLPPTVSDGRQMTNTVSTPSSFETSPTFLAIPPTSPSSRSPPRLPPRKSTENNINGHSLMPPAIPAMPQSDENTKETASTLRDLRNMFEGARLMRVRSTET
jgi:hypothetical protein